MLNRIVLAAVSFIALTSVATAHTKVQKSRYDGPACGQFVCVLAKGQAYDMDVALPDTRTARIQFRRCEPMPNGHARTEEAKSKGLEVFGCKDGRGYAYFVHEATTGRFMAANTSLVRAIDSGESALQKAKASDMWNE